MSIQLADTICDPAVFLAPMAGITDLPFRSLVQRFGAGLVVSEMVASQEMVQAKPGVRERAELGFNVENTAVQLAGRESHWMAEAARMVEANGARIIDINMGCPARKVTNGYSGSALMRTPDHALSLIEAVVDAVKVPVTLKTRLGWDEGCLNAPQIARRAQDAGVQMITIHGRTRCQFYKGQADWAAIAAVKQAVDVPVIANGDILNGACARAALAASGADGVMVGRAIRGRPWLLAEIAATLAGPGKGRHAAAPTDSPGAIARTKGPETGAETRPRIGPRTGPETGFAANTAPGGAMLADLVAGHYQDMLSFYGTDLGGRVARKHLGWYMDHAATPADLRRRVLTATDPGQVFRDLEVALSAEWKLAA